MHLTTAQYQLLKASIAADPVLSLLPNNSDGNTTIANAYNLPASPAFTVWKTNVSQPDIGNAIDATELVGLTTGKLTQLQTLLLFGEVNPSVANRRSAFDQIFSAASGTITRPALLVLWKRMATRFEKVLAIGTGSDASPATLGAGAEGVIDYREIELARNS